MKPSILDVIFPQSEGRAVLPPEVVIAAALSTIRWAPGDMHSPEDRVVSLIMTGLKQAGWQITPITKDKNDA